MASYNPLTVSISNVYKNHVWFAVRNIAFILLL